MEGKKLLKFVLVNPKDTNMLQKSLREEELAVLQRRNVWYMGANTKKQCVVRSRVVDAINKEKVRKTAVFNRKQPFCNGPSGETRTRGILLPKQARYQLRYTRIRMVLYTKAL